MKIKNFFFLTLTAILISHISMAQIASLESWKLLGTRTVDYTIDRDVITLDESKEPITALKFTVKNGTLNMHKCTVHFADGETKDIEFSEEVNKTNDGRMMDLKGSNKKIEKVTFWYDTKNSSDNKSVVEVWGKN